MSVISVIGPKGGIGKTTLSINITSALTESLKAGKPDNRCCLVDLDLRLPTISSLLDSHPPQTFYDLFETLANKTHQVDLLRNLYQILTWFRGHLEGEVDGNNNSLAKSLALYKNMSTTHFRFADFTFGDQIHELFLHRGKIHQTGDLSILKPLLAEMDLKAFKDVLRKHEDNCRPFVENHINYIEEYGFSIIGGEVPILGKKEHRKRINEPVFLMLFLDFLNEVFGRFDYVVLDTPAGGVNHLSSLMNALDHILFVFDLSNNIAINGSIDALHSFIDYYEDFLKDFTADRLTGLDKAYVNRLIAHRGRESVVESMENKKFGIVFNRFQEEKQILRCLDQLREYLDVLDKYESYKDYIQIVGMIPYCKIINITNNRGVLFYAKDRDLSGKMDMIARNIVGGGSECPTLAWSNDEILRYLRVKSVTSGMVDKLARLAKKIRPSSANGRKKARSPQTGGIPFHRG
ncbi:MAG: ParA family protein [Nitrospinales bacterium]